MIHYNPEDFVIESSVLKQYTGSQQAVTIPAGVTSIGESAFKDYRGLKSVTIPAGVTSIGDDAFEGCTGLTNITVQPGNTVYHSAGNCLIRTQSKTLIMGCQTSVIPTDGSVRSIGEGAFSGCTGLTSITIPDSVTSIGYGAFFECWNLTSVTIPNSMTMIARLAFKGCNSLTIHCRQDSYAAKAAPHEQWRVSIIQ